MSFDENRTHTGHGSVSTAVVRRSTSLSKRRDVARRHLIGSINARFLDVRYSSPGALCDHMKHDVKFPRVSPTSTRDRNVSGNKNKHAHVTSDRKSINSISTRNTKCDTTDDSDIVNSGNMQLMRKADGHQNVNLPGIIMQFNNEMNMMTYSDHCELSRPSTPDLSEDERAIGAPYEDYLRQRPNASIHNPCRAKYRPVTPGLLDALNKLKVPSKVKTEQWVKSTQCLQKSYSCHGYRTEQLHQLNFSYPSWIYNDMYT